MSKHLRIVMATLSTVFIAGMATPALAVDPFGGDACSGASASPLCDDLKDDTKLPLSINKIVNLMLYVLGAIAVIVIVIGGIMYTTSSGDPGKTKTAKDAILYAAIGLVVALLAYAIVNLVITNI